MLGTFGCNIFSLLDVSTAATAATLHRCSVAVASNDDTRHWSLRRVLMLFTTLLTAASRDSDSFGGNQRVESHTSRTVKKGLGCGVKSEKTYEGRVENALLCICAFVQLNN